MVGGNPLEELLVFNTLSLLLELSILEELLVFNPLSLLLLLDELDSLSEEELELELPYPNSSHFVESART